jgi:hypothetical protein
MPPPDGITKKHWNAAYRQVLKKFFLQSIMLLYIISYHIMLHQHGSSTDVLSEIRKEEVSNVLSV